MVRVSLVRLDRRRLLEDGFFTKDEGMLTVVVGTDAVGHVGWFFATWGPPTTSSCFSIFIGLQADQRRRSYGTEAQRLLCEYLFAHTRVERIQAFTDVDNVAERQALEKADFKRKGILRRAQWRDGAWHDMALYAALRN